ncbi:MAG TPA: hypothetical protein VEN81_01930, partial [Planctomycetota bacterium]|nr:hypothetical protein [Planctomycetota bacterium]
EEIILHAMERNPENRYRTVQELREELDHPEKVVVTGRAGRLEPPSAWAIRWRRSRQFFFTLFIIFAVLALFCLLLMKSGSPRRSAQRAAVRSSLGTRLISCSIPQRVSGSPVRISAHGDELDAT